MAEFKKLSAVEAVNTVSDTASVLIEEDGVIKRAPKGEIGGGVKVASTAEVGQTIVVKAVDEAGNPTEWECADLEKKPDMVLRCNTNPLSATVDNIEIVSGSMDAILTAYEEDRCPIVNVEIIYYYNEGNRKRSILSADTCFYSGYFYISCFANSCVTAGAPVHMRIRFIEGDTIDTVSVKQITVS